jgi:hypothetical protein
MTFPGLELVVASSAADVIGLMAAAVRDPDLIVFHEHKSLYATKGEVPNGKIVDKLGTAKILRADPEAVERRGTNRRALAPQTILGSVSKTGRLFTVENLSLCGRGAECRRDLLGSRWTDRPRDPASPARRLQRGAAIHKKGADGGTEGFSSTCARVALVISDDEGGRGYTRIMPPSHMITWPVI